MAIALLVLAGCSSPGPSTPLDPQDANTDHSVADTVSDSANGPDLSVVPDVLTDIGSTEAAADANLPDAVNDAPIDQPVADVIADVSPMDRPTDTASDVLCGGRVCTSAQTCCEDRCVNTAVDRFNCGACGAMCSGGTECCAGRCTPVLEDSNNCGACGATCVGLAHAASGRCTSGRCAVVSCAVGFGDCDLDGANGCEVNFAESVRHCGRCDNACPAVSFGDAVCAAGRCAARCTGSNGDCDSDPSSCETDLLGNFANCGACGNRCPSRPNSLPGCSAGLCLTVCNPGFVDCDGDPLNGCESQRFSDINNCGTCGNQCAFSHGLGSCATGRCALTRCDAGFGDCNFDPSDGCEVDLRSDNLRCGSCSGRCGTGSVCSNSLCSSTCGAGYSLCGGACRSITDDTNNCGACGRRCDPPPGSTVRCEAGVCAPTCTSGRADCNATASDGCEIDLYSDLNHCGACGRRCVAPAGATAVCRGGVCATVCPAGFADCDGVEANGCEVSTLSSADHCGACGQRCGFAASTSMCVASRCTLLACIVGYANCDGMEANGCETNILGNDSNNCNGCGTRCAAGTVCTAGRCEASCSSTQASCPPGMCADLQSDARNCGACGTRCLIGESCVAGRCGSPTPGNDLCPASNSRLGFRFGASPSTQTLAFTTRGAHREIQAPCITSPSGAEVFFVVTLAVPSLVYAQTSGTDFNTVLYFVRDCLVAEPRSSSGGFAYCNDNPLSFGCNSNNNPQVVGTFPAGTYYIAVAGSSPSDSGVGNLTMQTIPLPSGGTGSGLVRDLTASSFSGTLSGLGSLASTCGAPGPEAFFWWRSCPESRGDAIHVTGRVAPLLGAAQDASMYLLDASHGYDTVGCVRQVYPGLPLISALMELTTRPAGGGGIHGLYFDAAAASSQTYHVAFLPP